MLRRQSDIVRRRGEGFTMVEILIVIAIIGLLVALLLPAIIRALNLGPQTQNFSQIAQIGTAIGEAKRTLNLPQIPPGPFTLKNIYNGSEQEYMYLKQVWPQLNNTWAPAQNLYGTGLIPVSQGGNQNSQVVLDSNQTLLFFLTGGTVTNFSGFSTNPATPFTPPNAGDNRKGPFLQISTKSYVVYNSTTYSHPIFQATTSSYQENQTLQTITVTVATQSPAHAWVIDPYGMPYAYFASLNGKNGLYCAPPAPTISTLNTNLLQSFAVHYNVFPYPNPPPTLMPYTNNGSFINPDGVQIISSGKDLTFGVGGTLPPSLASGFDDQTNFSKTVLGGGIN